MADRPPPFRHGEGLGPPEPIGDRFRRSFRRFLIAAVVILAVGLGAGVLFGRADPDRAARLVVSEFTVTEDAEDGQRGPDPQLPTSGPERGEARCGRSPGPIGPETQVEVLAAGVVLVQHATELDDAAQAVLTDLAARDRVLVAPNDTLDGEVAVVATAWRQRMALDRVDRDLLDAFVTGHADRAPAVAPCPAPGP